MYRNHTSLSWALGLFFGWLLFFPFHGPAVLAWEEAVPAYLNYSTYFAVSHAFSFLLLGVVLPVKINWQKAMPWCASFCLFLTLFFVLPVVSGNQVLINILFVLMGVASAAYILGWILPYSLFLNGPHRTSFMALVIIKSNVIYLLFNLATGFLPVEMIMIGLAIPLIGAAVASARIDKINPAVPIPRPHDNQKFSAAFLVLLCLFVFGVFLSGGLMYSIIHPTFSSFADVSLIFRSAPYILVLILLLWKATRSNDQFIVYLGISLLGLSYVFFALLADSFAGYLITESLIQSAFAILDLFLWVLLADFALFYGHPYRVFGWGLFANVGAVVAGGFVGVYLWQLGDIYIFFTALIAMGAIFLSLVVVPPLFKGMEERSVSPEEAKKENGETDWEEILEQMVEQVPGTQPLTPREKEIAKLLLQGNTNKEIASFLFISDNTLKTHIRNVYRKLEVSQKRELLSMALGNTRTPENNNLSPPG